MAPTRIIEWFNVFLWRKTPQPHRNKRAKPLHPKKAAALRRLLVAPKKSPHPHKESNRFCLYIRGGGSTESSKRENHLAKRNCLRKTPQPTPHRLNQPNPKRNRPQTPLVVDVYRTFSTTTTIEKQQPKNPLTPAQSDGNH